MASDPTSCNLDSNPHLEVVSSDSQHESRVAHVIRPVWVKPSVAGWSVTISCTPLHLGIITQQNVDDHPRVTISRCIVECRFSVLQQSPVNFHSSKVKKTLHLHYVQKKFFYTFTEWWDAGMAVSGSRCKFAYGPADATATHYLLLH